VAAVVAGDPAVAAVQDQRHVAMWAAPGPPAAAAGDEVRPSAPVQEDDRLLSPRAHLLERVTRSLVKRAARRGHADDLDRWERPAVHALGQRQPPQAAPALGPRGGRAGQQHGAALRGAPLGHAAGVVARVALLLVRGIVLLVDDDQPEVGQRREHRGPRPDADARLAAAQPQPLVVALARAQLGVQDRDLLAEPLPEPAGGLRGERDLRDQHDRRAPPVQGRRNGAQVDLGLAAAGDAVQEQPAVAVRRPHEPAHLAERLGLLGRQARLRRAAAANLVELRAAPHLDVPDVHQPAHLQRAQRRVVAAGLPAGARRAAWTARQGRQHRPLARPEALAIPGRVPAGRGQPHLERAADPGGAPHARSRAGRQDEREPARGRGAVLLGDPQPQAHQLRRHPAVEGRERLGKPFGRKLALVGDVDDHAEQPPPGERDDEHAAHPHLRHVRRDPVVEGPAQGSRGGERLHLGDHASRR
jgi:hypothetical protein